VEGRERKEEKKRTLRTFLLFFASLVGSFSIFFQSKSFRHRSSCFNFFFDLLQAIERLERNQFQFERMREREGILTHNELLCLVSIESTLVVSILRILLLGLVHPYHRHQVEPIEFPL